MKRIGGNLTAELQLNTEDERNEIGEVVPVWETVNTLTGWLDLSSGDSRYTSYDAKIQESTHIFLCDYSPLGERITAENSRLLIKGKTYDINVIDNVMEMDRQLEFYLKYRGN